MPCHTRTLRDASGRVKLAPMARRKKSHEPTASEEPDAAFEAFLQQVGERVREIRTMQGLTKVAAGEFTGVGAPQLSRIEQGRVNLTLRLLYRLAEGLGVPPYELLLPREQSDVLPIRRKKSRRAR